jgi:hypothetical protein
MGGTACHVCSDADKCLSPAPFTQAVMELLSDAVPNVRLAALSLLPALKQTIRLPEDVQQLVRPCLVCHQEHPQLLMGGITGPCCDQCCDCSPH